MRFEAGHKKLGGIKKGSSHRYTLARPDPRIIDNEQITAVHNLLFDLLFDPDQTTAIKITLLKILIPYIFLKPLSDLDVIEQELKIEIAKVNLAILQERHSLATDTIVLDTPHDPWATEPQV